MVGHGRGLRARHRNPRERPDASHVFPRDPDRGPDSSSSTNQDALFLPYNGLLLTLEKRWSERWQALVSYSISEAVGLQATSADGPGGHRSARPYGYNGFGRDPNDYTNATGPLNNDRTHMFRVQGAVEIPRVGILVGANFQYLTGQPWAARQRAASPGKPSGS